MYGDITQRKRVIRVNRVENPLRELSKALRLLHRLNCSIRCVNRNTIPARQHAKALDMIGMLMCHENAVQLLRAAIENSQPRLHALSADARIDQKACGLASRENAVSARTTCNTTKFHIFSSYGLTVFLFPQNRRCCRFQNRSGC